MRSQVTPGQAEMHWRRKELGRGSPLGGGRGTELWLPSGKTAPFSVSFQCPHINVRKSAFDTLGQFCISLHRVCERDPSEAHRAGA